MSKLTLMDAQGNLVENASQLLYAHVLFPSDQDSQRQALALASDEGERFNRAGGPQHYQPSELSQRIVTALNGDAGRRAVAGFTAIAFSLLKASRPEKPATVYAAAQVVERALKKFSSKADPKPIKTLHYRDGEWLVKGQQCPKTRRGIEQAWQRYCSVSHLIAADCILAEWFPASLLFERKPEYTITLMRTASVFEPHIREPVEERGFEIVEVAHQFKEAAWEVPTIPMGKSLIEFLESGLEV